jgi:hypothetical protein
MNLRFLFGAAALCSAAHLHAGEPVSGSIDAAPDGEVKIDVVRGAVSIVGWDEARVVVEGTRDEASEAFVFVREGNVVRIEDRLRQRVRGGDGTRLTVRVPRSSQLRGTFVSADVDVHDVLGGARLQMVSGDLNAEGLGGAVNVRTVSGAVSVAHAGEEISFDTVSGRIEARLDTQRAEVKTVSGSVELHNVGALRRARLSSVSGGLRITTALAAGGELAADTVSGDLGLTLPPPVDARVFVDAGPGGSIRNRLSGAHPEPVRRGPSQRLELVLGTGQGTIELKTLSGALELREP